MTNKLTLATLLLAVSFSSAWAADARGQRQGLGNNPMQMQPNPMQMQPPGYPAGAGGVPTINLSRGQQLYNLHCASCHGMTGIPVTPDTPNLAMRERMDQPDVALMQSLKMGKKNKPPFFGILKDDELFDIIRYVRIMR